VAPEKETVQTGEDCVKAEAQCGGGLCTADLKNDCDQAVTCDVAITNTCQSGTAMVEAKGRKRDTVAAKSTGRIQVEARCNEGEILHTELKSMICK
jgi:hypothetical protein